MKLTSDASFLEKPSARFDNKPERRFLDVRVQRGLALRGKRHVLGILVMRAFERVIIGTTSSRVCGSTDRVTGQ